jgi:hypothetical protein
LIAEVRVLDRRVLAEDHHLQVALEVLEHVLVRCADLLGRDARHLGDDRSRFLGIDQALALAVRQQALAGSGFVDHVDGLVGQQAVAEVLDRQVDGGLQRLVGIGHAVVLLVLGLEPCRISTGLADRRLDDVDLLEAPGQSPVLSKMPRYSWNVVEPMQRSSPDARPA